MLAYMSKRKLTLGTQWRSHGEHDKGNVPSESFFGDPLLEEG